MEGPQEPPKPTSDPNFTTFTVGKVGKTDNKGDRVKHFFLKKVSYKMVNNTGNKVRIALNALMEQANAAHLGGGSPVGILVKHNLLIKRLDQIEKSNADYKKNMSSLLC